MPNGTHTRPGATAAARLETIRWHNGPMPTPTGRRTAGPSDAPRTRRGADGVGFVVLIGLMSLLPAVATDMYLPSLPEVAADLSTTAGAAQFTITGMLIGGALGQLVVGPLSDRFGRRRPVMVGVTLHALLSIACAVAGTIGQLSTLRVLQGLAAAGATVTSMAVVRDRYTGADAARLLSRLMLVIAVAPLFAPSIGAAIASVWDWRAVFVVLAAVAIALAVVVTVALPETLPPERRVHHGVRRLAHGYVDLLRDGRFVALALLPGLGMTVVMSYVAGSPFVMREEFGLTTSQFSIVFAVVGTAMVVGSQVNAGIVRRVGPLRLLRIGLPASALAAVGLLVGAVVGAGPIAFVASLWVVFALMGFVFANASALAMSRHGERAGTAAATIGFVQAGLAGAVSPLVGVLGSTAVAVASLILASLVLGTVLLAAATPAYRRGGWLGIDQVVEPVADAVAVDPA